MSEPLGAQPWLTVIGLGEDGPDGLSVASHKALSNADVVVGPARHLALLGGGVAARRLEWPVPFADGLALVLKMRGQRVVVLASGDPFWFGAGAVLAQHLAPEEWVAHPAPACFGWAAARLGWRLEDTPCLGLHAAPLARLRPYLAPGQKIFLTLRDGAAVADLAAYLRAVGCGDSDIWVMEALGGPRERLRCFCAKDTALPPDIQAPVLAAVLVRGWAGISMAAGQRDELFDHDGQITKRPVRALTLSTLAPRPGELLWDIGAGSGSISIEWLLAHPANRAIAVEADPVRAARARANSQALGVDRLQVVLAQAPSGLEDLPSPDAVFIGGGVDEEMLTRLWGLMPKGARLVANAVTLEGEALFAQWQARVGGHLLRIELAEATPLGRKRGWRSAMPVVQWSVVR